MNFSIFVGSGIGPRTCAPVRFAVETISFVEEVEDSMIERLEANADILAVHKFIPCRPAPEGPVGRLNPVSCRPRVVCANSRKPGSFDRNALIRARYSVIEATTPAPTVRPPSRIAKRSFSSIAIGTISSTSIVTLSPGITISVPSGRVTTPVTSVVRK